MYILKDAKIKKNFWGMSHILDVFFFVFFYLFFILLLGGGLNSRCWVSKENTNTNRCIFLRGWVQDYVSRKKMIVVSR